MVSDPREEDGAAAAFVARPQKLQAIVPLCSVGHTDKPDAMWRALHKGMNTKRQRVHLGGWLPLAASGRLKRDEGNPVRLPKGNDM